MSEQYNTWILIQDIIGPASSWPHLIRKLFWTKNVTHFNRVLMVAFVYVNGLHFDVFLKWCEIIGSYRDRAARNHVIALHKLIENQKYKSTSLYAYNVFQKRYEYLDGSFRRYIHRSRRT